MTDDRSVLPDSFVRDGYFLYSNTFDADWCSRIGREVIAEHDRLTSAGWRFAAGGRYTGHLNFHPGPHAKPILEALRDAGFIALAEKALGGPVSLFGMVGNMNLPSSHDQDIHQDWAPPGEALVFNIAVVPTTMENGPTEIVPGSQGGRYTYTSLHLSGARRRAEFWQPSPGDMIMRLASTWHRGTRNRSTQARPMLSVILVRRGDGSDGPSVLDAPQEERIRFHANRFFGRHARTRELASIWLAGPMHVLRLARGR